MPGRHHGGQRLRIIGGQWRGRLLNFPAVAELRPTLDRVRETVFNWLQPVIGGATCLDLFAGSGALGFEAASRGSTTVVMVEANAKVVRNLRLQAESLNATQVSIYQADALTWLRTTAYSFDIIFLDPPFGRNLLTKAINQLRQNRYLEPGAYIYIEMEADQALPELPENWEIVRSKQAGQVKFYLARAISEFC